MKTYLSETIQRKLYSWRDRSESQYQRESKIIQQKSAPITIHLQDAVGKELKKKIKSGHIEKTNDIDENCFVSPAGIIVKRDKSMKIARDSRKLKDFNLKRTVQMSNMEELISRISRRITEGKQVEVWISKFDLDYTHGQLKVSEGAKNLSIFTVTGVELTVLTISSSRDFMAWPIFLPFFRTRSIKH